MALPCSALIFDLDGTLLDSLEDLADAANNALAAFGFPTHPLDPYRYFVGNGMRNLVRSAAPQGTDEAVIDDVFARTREEYGRRWAKKTRPYEGIVDMLTQLCRQGVPLLVLTNKPHDFALEIMAHFFSAIPFARIQGSLPERTAKPDPAFALAMAQELRLDPETIFFLGDTRVDMDTAVNAGMTPVGALWGFRPADELREHGARILLEHPMELFRHMN